MGYSRRNFAWVGTRAQILQPKKNSLVPKPIPVGKTHPISEKNTLNLNAHTVEARHNEVPKDWQNMFVIRGLFSMHVAITGLKSIIRYTGVFVIQGYIPLYQDR